MSMAGGTQTLKTPVYTPLSAGKFTECKVVSVAETKTLVVSRSIYMTSDAICSLY